MNSLGIAQADCVVLPMAMGSAHCAVFSPPYWNLRRYQGQQERDWPAGRYAPMPGLPECVEVPAMRCAMGEEPTLEAYTWHTLLYMREVWRVLRDDGVVWLNISDSFSNDPGNGRGGEGPDGGIPHRSGGDKSNVGIAHGNQFFIPHRLMLALQATGWTIRQTYHWLKKSPMPESVNGVRWKQHQVKVAKSSRADGDSYHSVAYGDAPQGARDGRNFANHAKEWRDCPGCPKCEPNEGLVLRRGRWRHTSAHEYVFMLSKGDAVYWCDGERVKEEAKFGRRDWSNIEGNLSGIGIDGKRGHATVSGVHPETGRNPRNFALLSSEPWYGFNIGGDYVGEDGKSYTASPDCPIHGHLARNRKPLMVSGDELQGVQSSRIAGIDNDPAEGLSSEPRASDEIYNAYRESSRPSTLGYQGQDTSLLKNIGNIDENKTQGKSKTVDVSTSGGKRIHHTKNIQVEDERLDDSQDYSSRKHEEIAISRNKRNRKKDHAQLTNSQDISSAQKSSHTDDKPILPVSSEQGHDKDGNNILQNDSSVRLSEEIPDGIVGISSQPDYTCKCKVSRADHYATYPRALIAPLIRASCPRWACPVCGAGWSPVVEREYGIRDDGGRTHGKAEDRMGKTPPPERGWETDSRVIAYCPTCTHPHTREDTRPGLVLDPFCGSGTTLMVARELGVRAIGFDLSMEYLDEQAGVRALRRTPSRALETLPLFD